jgi:MFS superfamily sulfate permease-like transporter
LAGIFQLILGFIKAGSLSNYIPSNVIEGMLAGIGVIIFFKQLPYALGINSGLNNTSSPSELLSSIHYGSLLITIISVALLLSWDKIPFLKKIKLIPSALVVVIIGILINYFFVYTKSSLAISKDQLVTLPIPESIDELKSIFTSPNFSSITNPKVWSVAITIAIVASIETLLCIEAADRIDFQKRNTNTNIELIAQGTGNIVSSLLGGLPMTSVIVRTSANNNAGAQTKLSTIFHGLLLLVCAITIPWLLNKIPLATLASILLLIGYKLANPSVIKHFWLKGKYQFIPFIATLLAVVFMDLLKGVALGIVISIFFILKGNLKKAFTLRKDNNEVTHIDLAQEVSFLNKAEIKSTLNEIPENTKVIINAVDTVYITHDVLDILKEFQNIQSKNRNITVELINFRKEYQL